MIRRQQRIERIVRVEKEFLAGRSALETLGERLRADPNFGEPYGWRFRDAANLVENMEPTYLIRLCAEFESGLRDVWANYLVKRRIRP